jgi:pectin methylesterase-like acyl-CoA thioesterase
MRKKPFIIILQSNRNSKTDNHSYQLSLPLALDRNQQKPQISSIPGISPKQRDRYQVVFRDQVLGNHLTLDEAIALAKRRGAK